ncbi:TRAP transporter small permease [Candidatus Halobeggiatoa sp. HSG11]|nr:TRAP transporter small permease [Candidatus Halobeggiatoa sp. HSG11]
MRFYLSALDRMLTLFEEVIITVGLGTATILIFANVIARYMFDTGFPWVLETVQYLFAWVVLVGSAYGFREGIHLGVDILVLKFSPIVRRWIGLSSLALCLVFVVTVFILSLQYITKIYQWGDLTLDLQIPQWIPYLAIPIGLFLMTIHLLQVGWLIWQGKQDFVGQSERTGVE